MWLCSWDEKVDTGKGYFKSIKKTRIHAKHPADFARLAYGQGQNTYTDWLEAKYKGQIELINEPK